MSLRKCPECGEMISSTSLQCVHCGYRFKVCPSCGEWMKPEEVQCPNCGYSEPAPKPPLHLPRVKLECKRRLLKYILWNILSFGIYSLYFIQAASHEVNLSCGEDGKKTRGLIFYLVINALTFGIYRWVWGYGISARLAEKLEKANVKSPVSGMSWFLWDFFGALLLGAGPLVAQYQLIHALNEANRLYSVRESDETESEEQKLANDISAFYYDSKVDVITRGLSSIGAVFLIAACIFPIPIIISFIFDKNIGDDLLLFWLMSCAFLLMTITFSIYYLATLLKMKHFLKGKDTKRHTEFCVKLDLDKLGSKDSPEWKDFSDACFVYEMAIYATENRAFLAGGLALGIVGLLTSLGTTFLLFYFFAQRSPTTVAVIAPCLLGPMIEFCGYLPLLKKVEAWKKTKAAQKASEKPQNTDSP